MGLHQDKDESAESIAAGCPVVSFSIGDTRASCSAVYAGRIRWRNSTLASGDVFVFGGESRLRYHGVTRILPGTAPPGLPFEGRLNLTFRRF